jgi:hypothetical protein
LAFVLEKIYEFPGGARESVGFDFGKRNPDKIVTGQGLSFTFGVSTLKGMKGDTEVGEGVFDGAESVYDFNIDARGVFNTADACVLKRFSALLCACWKFPEATE